MKKPIARWLRWGSRFSWTILFLTLFSAAINLVLFVWTWWGPRAPVELMKYDPTNERVSLTFRQGTFTWTEEWWPKDGRITLGKPDAQEQP